MRAALILSFIFAGFQSFAITRVLAGLPVSEPLVSSPLSFGLSLVAGHAALLVVAFFISRRGIMNGVVVVFFVGAAVEALHLGMAEHGASGLFASLLGSQEALLELGLWISAAAIAGLMTMGIREPSKAAAAPQAKGSVDRSQQDHPYRIPAPTSGTLAIHHHNMCVRHIVECARLHREADSLIWLAQQGSLATRLRDRMLR